MTSALYRVTWLMLVFFVTSVPANAQTSAIEKSLSNPQQVGEARLKVMMWNVFDASLYSETGLFDKNEAFALELTYLRNIKSKKIVSKSMQEIRRMATTEISAISLRGWKQQLSAIIPDVRVGMSITGVRSPEGHTLFYVGDEMKGRINDTEFTDAFFDIWLGENTAEPKLRRKLTGLDRSA